MKRIRRNFPLLVLYRQKDTNFRFRHLVQSLWALAFLPVVDVVVTYVDLLQNAIIFHQDLFEND